MTQKFATAAFYFIISPLFLTAAHANIDDSGLTGPVMPLQMSVSNRLAPSEIVRTPLKSNDLTVSSYVRKGGELQELKHLTFSSQSSCQGRSIGDEIAFESEFSSQYVNVKKSAVYRIEFVGSCGSHHDLIFDSESPEGQAVTIWEVANRAVSQFSKINRLDFWGGPLQINWPGDGDFYSWGTVHITRGDYWDVVGHEIGHAIYDRANIGVFGGGQHYIDQCYTESLALSEGWASFFSAWVSVDLNDPNARFEFMVPRRAPLGIETVPDDVCAGPTNEWRVYTFLWDVIDGNQDGEVTSVEFQKYWDLALNQNVRSIQHKKTVLIEGGVSQDQLHQIWTQNFKTNP